MPEITLAAETGRRPGSSDARRLRTAGKIPAVVYGHGQDPLPVAVDARALRAALNTDAGLNALLDLTVDGASHLTLAREVQRHPVRNTVTNVDFLVVRRDEVISAEVPIALVGDPVTLHRGDGVVDQELFSLTVFAVPGRIPNVIEIDITDLEIGQTIRVGNLGLPTGVTAELDDEAAVVVGQPPQVGEPDLGEEPAPPAAPEGGEG
ncbi:MAG: 50S ribosomal protein L25 [Acidimicrobiales bacterium]